MTRCFGNFEEKKNYLQKVVENGRTPPCGKFHGNNLGFFNPSLINMTLSSKYLSRNHQYPSSTAFKKGCSWNMLETWYLAHKSRITSYTLSVLSQIPSVSYHILLTLSKISLLLSPIPLALYQIPLVSIIKLSCVCLSACHKSNTFFMYP